MKPIDYKKRLEALADFLVTVPASKFDFNRYATGLNLGKPDCGTVGCALGWATTMSKFRRLGLRLKKHSRAAEWLHIASPCIIHTQLEDLEVATDLFGMSEADAKYVFLPRMLHHNWPHLKRSPDEEATPKQVAAHIRYFIKETYTP